MRVKPTTPRSFRMMKSSEQIIAYLALGAAIHYTVSTLWGKVRSSSSQRTPGNAWTLVVTLTFTSEEDQQNILNEWKPVTKYCKDEEPFLLHYEAGRSDSDPLKIHMVERYQSKDHYLNFHKNGAEFLKFRPKLKALQDAGKVKVVGFSYQELGYGFV